MDLKHFGNPYYTEVNTLDIERARTKIKGVLQQALDENIITNNEFDSMNPENKEEEHFYCNFKVHKPHGHKKSTPRKAHSKPIGYNV